MVIYPEVTVARFKERKNRFIAHCLLPDTLEEVVVHVKNTGRCRELLLPNVEVALSFQGSPTRKTDYDLIAVKKGQQWINIDSQVPNQLAFEGIKNKTISLPGLRGELTVLKREVTFGESRFDLYVETSEQQKAIIEVKGMTLENQQIGAFPDAPTERGLKHVKGLIEYQKAGYQTYLLFIVQLTQVTKTTINQVMQPALRETISGGLLQGLQVLSYDCQVTPDTIAVKGQVPFDLVTEFTPPNSQL
ncbi:DNA/RNA nuclease SfsA [Vagococcus salmoninarum]|uniref:Sugar fermentation stimulation protein homolog n=1 Tax=Vagococcus salmoninarum TaxID=2739 RepID=A0A429ZKH6_9ENTE|nr:DNA/RNA nuclease SfsA [Vagococcus salmoninarum]RST94181.1 sugar fermentation stimulation protein SfsA [Vagococcus salmoninarum]